VAAAAVSAAAAAEEAAAAAAAGGGTAGGHPGSTPAADGHPVPLPGSVGANGGPLPSGAKGAYGAAARGAADGPRVGPPLAKRARVEAEKQRRAAAAAATQAAAAAAASNAAAAAAAAAAPAPTVGAASSTWTADGEVSSSSLPPAYGGGRASASSAAAAAARGGGDGAAGAAVADLAAYAGLPFAPTAPGGGLDVDLFLRLRARVKAAAGDKHLGIKDDAVALLATALEAHIKTLLEAAARRRAAVAGDASNTGTEVDVYRAELAPGHLRDAALRNRRLLGRNAGVDLERLVAIR